MGHLEINGFEVGAKSVDAADDGPSFQQRMYSGKLFRDEIADQQRWSFTSGLLLKAERDQLRHLVRGDGEHWSFDVDKYGSKGTGPDEETGWTIPDANAKYGAGGLRVTGGGPGEIAYSPAWFPSGGLWTVAYWRDDSGIGTNWEHIVITSDARKWLDGVRADGTGTDEFSETSGTFAWNDDPGYYDDIVILPWEVTDAFGDSFPQTYAYPELPKLRADGDEFESPPVTVMGEFGGSSVIGGVTDYYRAEFELAED